MRCAPATRSQVRTDVTVRDTSEPYAPTFWMGVAPTLPGMPESISTPLHSCVTAWKG